jgi:hypothetical protein
MDSMPKMRTAFARGLAGTWSSPVVVGALLAWLLVEWVVIVTLGYPGPVALMAYLSAPPPLSTNTDLFISIGILGGRGLTFVFVPAAVHALWMAVLTGLAIETIETGTASRWGAVRGLRALPVTLALHIIGVAVVFASQIVVAFGGSSLGFFLLMGVLVAAVWALAFAPAIAVTEHRRVTECLARSVRAARMPGSGNLSFAAIYAVPVIATFLAPSVPGTLLDVNPPYTAWIFVVGMNLLHAAVLAAFSMRYLAVADEVPDPRPRQAARAAAERSRKPSRTGASTKRRRASRRR